MKGFSIKGKLIISFMSLVAIGIFIVTTVAITLMEKSVINTVLEKAKSDSATGLELIERTYPGEWSVKDGQLFKGTHRMNEDFAIVDRIAELTGDTVTVFLGDTRISTTVKKDGVRAIGTKVSEKVKSIVLTGGEGYYGEADVVGIKYQTAYVPLKDVHGKVIGIWYVGVSQRFLDTEKFGFIIKVSIAAAISLMIAVLLGWFIAKNISNPIFKIKALMEKVEQGDFTQEAQINTSDEVGMLAQSFNKMSAHTRSTVSDIITASEELEISSQGFFRNSDSLTRSIQEVTMATEALASGAADQTRDIIEIEKIINKLNQAIGSIANGAGEQANHVNQTSVTFGNMATSIEEVASSAHLATGTSEEATVVANLGGQAVKEVISGMDSIKAKVFDAANKIEELGSKSQQIGEIIQVIDEIAEQTNLLALNAAIEAARAGEHGKGFAVVADEVRKLAERSGKATKEIAELINSIQLVTKNAVLAMGDGTREVEKGAGLAADAGDALDRILDNVGKTNDEIHKISGATQKLSELSTEVVNLIEGVANITEANSLAASQMIADSEQAQSSIREITEIAQSGAAAAEEMSASSEQMHATSETISSSSHDLVSMVERLRNLTSSFKL